MAQISGTNGRTSQSRRPPKRIVLVGAGDCGTRAALHLRDFGFEGSITLVGDEDVAPYERPELSKSVLIRDHAVPAAIAGNGRLEALAITWRAGARAERIEPDRRRVKLADGAVISYDRLLIATGARARRPAVPTVGVLPDPIHVVRSFADAVRLRERLSDGVRVLVIGGGFVGLEVAASAVQRGCEVTVAEFAHRLMSRVVPAPVAQIVHERHTAKGVKVRCGTGVERLTARGRSVRARLTDDTVVEADVVVAGVGAIPNTELAATGGLRLNNGVAVDDRLRTSDRSIFAAGDCCSFLHPLYAGRVRLEAWRNALAQAKVVARNMLGADDVFDEVPWFWSDQYDLQLQVAGLHAAAVTDVDRRTADGHEIRFGLDPAGRVVSASAVAFNVAVARELQIAKRMIAARSTPVAAELADPGVDLRSLVNGGRGVARSRR